MILPRPQDAIHKTHLYRLLMEIIDSRHLARFLYFKGGTCAALAGWLDRFSLDLDFDVAPRVKAAIIKEELTALAGRLGFTVKQQKDLFFVFGYTSRPRERNSIKISVFTERVRANQYAPVYLTDIRRYAMCQTRDTMVANKLIAPLDRYDRYGTIAGRDIYDIHYFLSHGYPYRPEVIVERRRVKVQEYIAQLVDFIDHKVTQRLIAEDLNYLLPLKKFQAIRKTLKEETILLLRDSQK
ncbi:hypothetical protein A2Z00_04365 [Candidatus Gottesmanbacteria bacterium RBG_13_45_10]|uniref:Nucleotidyl transferase AbiEii/AbiGii toxin family protein n=1 Tax=Candidatus Gottesmanbacteria bacterium RBG_13_45_10 TaxID=1798370 RepID=A0A1F5ZHD2_9BACT|nr:MAG: hypothetical protein A2Z00_04365 [Candidatus Gottesmanbacteria bacterium RBG_13_45_10]